LRIAYEEVLSINCGATDDTVKVEALVVDVV
jgi:hypothetical protein